MRAPRGFGAVGVAAGVGAALLGCAPVAGADPSGDREAGTRSVERVERAERVQRVERPARRAPHPAAAQARSGPRPHATPTASRTTAPSPTIAAATTSDGGWAALFANQSPVASPTVNAQGAAGRITGTINAADADSGVLRYSVTDAPAHGEVTVEADGDFIYIPDSAVASAGTTDSFVVSVSDAEDGFHVHGLPGLINLLTFGLIGASGHVTSTTVRLSVNPFETGDTTPGPVTPPPPPTPPPGADRLAVGMNLESIVDYSPAWTFTDAFKASRPWISQSFNPQTFALTWDAADAPVLDLDGDGNVRSLKTWTQNGVTLTQYAGTLMFDALGGDYAAGTYHAEWDGTGVVRFGFDAVVTSSGRTPEGRNFAELRVTPTDDGIYLRIESTSPTDPVRNFNVWMPDYNGQSFVGQRWSPGADFSPFHPLFLDRLEPFSTLRFMAWQETNTSDIETWSQRRDWADIRQGSGPEGTPSEPIANGVSVEYMVELANALDADPWFNMPYRADDTFVRNFASYVSTHLEPGRTVYVEWANEVWNFGYGFEASQWVADKARAAGLDPDYGQWIVAGQEAKRDLDIWSQVLGSRPDLRLVRVAGGWAAVDWVTNEILENMGGSFDAVAIAPYITPTDEQRASYGGATTVDRILADTRTNIATSLQWTAAHELLTDEWTARLGRPITLVAYEGGAHLDGRGAAYQNAFYGAGIDPRMGEIYADYIRGLDSAGLDLYVDFQFTGQAGAAPWGDFAKLHRMDEPLSGTYRYNAVVDAANGSLWS